MCLKNTFYVGLHIEHHAIISLQIDVNHCYWTLQREVICSVQMLWCNLTLTKSMIEGERACLPGVNPNPNKTGANRRPQSGAKRCPVLSSANRCPHSHSKTVFNRCDFAQILRADENGFSCQPTVEPPNDTGMHACQHSHPNVETQPWTCECCFTDSKMPGFHLNSTLLDLSSTQLCPWGDTIVSSRNTAAKKFLDNQTRQQTNMVI